MKFVINIHGRDRRVSALAYKCFMETKLDEIEPYISEFYGIDKVYDEDSENGWGALHVSIAQSKLDFVEELLKKGADPNIKTSDGQTPFHFVFYYFFPQTPIFKKMVKLLLQYGADPNCKNDSGKNLWEMYTDIELFLENGATLETTDPFYLKMIEAYHVRINNERKLNFMKACLRKKGTFLDLIPVDLVEFEILSHV